MLGRLKSFGSELVPRIHAWTSDRGQDQLDGERLLDEGHYPEAEVRLAKALVECERKRQPVRRRIELRLELAEAQRRQHQPETDSPSVAKLRSAEESALSALELAARSAEKELQVQCLDVLAAILADAGDSEGVERRSEEAARLETALPRPDLLRKAQRLKLLGSARQRTGRVSDAAAAYKEALALTEQIHGASHSETGSVLTELGEAYRFLGNHASAQECLYRALRIHEKEYGIDSPEAVHNLSLYSASCEASGNIKDAAEQHERILGLKLRVVGADLEKIARAQMELAAHYVRWENPSRARELVMEAIGTFKRKRGAELASAYETLATIEERRGQYIEAVREMENAARLWEGLPTEHAHELIRNLEYRARLLDRLRMNRDAEFLREKLAALVQADRWAAAS